MPIQVLSIPERGFVALILPDPGRRTLRFLFSYQGELRALCWMNIGADGSLYLNHRFRGATSIFDGAGVADGTGGFSDVSWQEIPVADLDDPTPKISQHASGRTKRAEHRNWSVNVRNVDESVLVRQDEYAHPSRFQVIAPDALRSMDLIVPGQGGGRYEIRDDRPLTSRVYVAPLRERNAQVPLIEDPAADTQTAVIVPATNLRRCQDLTYQLQFFNRSVGTPWPEISTVAVLNTE